MKIEMRFFAHPSCTQEVMSQFVVTCSSDTAIAQVATQMLTHHIHCFPVIGEEKELA